MCPLPAAVWPDAGHERNDIALASVSANNLRRYCTADAHLGARRAAGVHFNGRANVQSALDYVLERIPTPLQTLTTGWSAGALASVAWLPWIAQQYPSSQHLQFGDSFVGVSTKEHWSTLEDTWDLSAAFYPGMWQEDELQRAGDDISAFIIARTANHLTNITMAQFTFDADAVQSGFFMLMGSTTPFSWTEKMRQTIPAVLEAPNSALLIAPGAGHTTIRGPEFYEVEVGGTRLVDWLAAMVDGSEYSQLIDGSRDVNIAAYANGTNDMQTVACSARAALLPLMYSLPQNELSCDNGLPTHDTQNQIDGIPTWNLDLFTCDEGRACFDHIEAYILLALVAVLVLGTVCIQVLFHLSFRGVVAEQQRVMSSLDHVGMPKREMGSVPTVSFESLSYTVNGTQILSNVSGVFHPGELVAVMGGSGSGKTTLIDILTGRRSAGEVTGHIRYNDTELPDAKEWLRKNGGYVVQEDDELARTLTVREVLTFAALLKLSPTEPLADRLMHVEEIIDEFGLRNLAETVVQTSEGGLSGGQRRRLAVAKEMLQSPDIVYLDEPTSGLDASSTLELVQCLRHVASTGRIVIASIHQPRVEVFNLFSQIYILLKGRTVFSGTPSAAIQHFLSAATADLQLATPTAASAVDWRQSVDSRQDTSPPDDSPRTPDGSSPTGRLKISTLAQVMNDCGVPFDLMATCLDGLSVAEIKQSLIDMLDELQHSATVEFENPADMILDAMLGPNAVPEETLVELHQAGTSVSKINAEIAEIAARGLQLPTHVGSSSWQGCVRFATRVWTAETRALRIQTVGDQIYVPLLLLADCVALGTLYWQQKNFVAISSVMMMMMTFGPVLCIAGTVTEAMAALKAFDSEYRYALMSTPAFIMQQILHTFTFAVLPVATFFGPAYWMIYTNHSFDEWLWSLVLIYALAIWCAGFTLALTVLMDAMGSDAVAIMVAINALHVFWQTFSDMFLPIADAPEAWHWAFYVSPFYWIYLPILHINFKGESRGCDLSVTSLADCFSQDGDAVLEYHDATDINFAQGPLWVLLSTVVSVIVMYEVLKGKRVPSAQLQYSGRAAAKSKDSSTTASREVEFNNPMESSKSNFDDETPA